MLRCLADDLQKIWNANVSSLIYTYNSQLQIFTNTRLFDLVLNQRISYVTLEFIVFTAKWLIAAEQRIGFLSTLLRSLNFDRVSSQGTEERNK